MKKSDNATKERIDVFVKDVSPIDIVLIDTYREYRFKDYWSLLDHVMHQTLDITTNSPEEYDVLDAEERKKLDAVHAAWFPNL